MHIASRMAEIEPFHVMRVLARARELEAQGRAIVHMEVGEPDFDTPEPITQAGIKALRQGQTHYTPAVGLTALREAIAGFYGTRYGVSVDPARVIVTPGASGALLLTMGVLVGPGDEVLLADPGYPCNRHFVRLMEGRPVTIPVGPDSGFQLDATLIQRHWSEQSVAAMLASPSNPTGTLVASDRLAAMAAVLSDKGGHLVMDEIYHGLVYQGQVSTALSLDYENVFVINSFSKYFGMTGWRLGWLIVPEAYCHEVEKLAQNIFIAPPTPAQVAALAAFEPETLAVLEERRDAFRRRRDYLVPALKRIGFDIPVAPDGAFYIYADCTRFTQDSYEFTLKVLEEVGVAFTPGLDFGSHQSRRYVRFAYTTSLEQLEEGIERLSRLLA